MNVKNGSVLFQKELDFCFPNVGIYRVKEGYIIHGEMRIQMLDTEFNKVWEFWGKDIFFNYRGKKAFELCDSMIKLYDFEDNYYELDYQGKQINSNE